VLPDRTSLRRITPLSAWWVVCLGALTVGLLAALPTAADATYPGRNGRIAYEGGGSDQTHTAFGVYSVRPDGTGQRLILRNAPFSPHLGVYLTGPIYSQPAYAPRGARIAFVSSSPSALGPDRLIGSIGIARSDGSQRRELITAGPYGSVSSPQWAPDGRAIVFFRDPCGAYNQGDNLDCPPGVYRPRDYGLFVYRRGRIRLVTHDVYNDAISPSWSPNGRLIAFVSGGTLYVIRPDGAGRRRILDSRSVGSVDWSPNGRRLVIGYTAHDGWQRVATIRSDGRGFRRLTNGLLPAYSPDGRQIVFTGTRNGSFLMTMRVDGTRQRRIRPPSGNAINYALSSAWQPLPARPASGE
jgi:dipeptidyl aminopeptidase/acylaminoacyl peptidase